MDKDSITMGIGIIVCCMVTVILILVILMFVSSSENNNCQLLQQQPQQAQVQAQGQGQVQAQAQAQWKKGIETLQKYSSWKLSLNASSTEMMRSYEVNYQNITYNNTIIPGPPLLNAGEHGSLTTAIKELQPPKLVGYDSTWYRLPSTNDTIVINVGSKQYIYRYVSDNHFDVIYRDSYGEFTGTLTSVPSDLRVNKYH